MHRFVGEEHHEGKGEEQPLMKRLRKRDFSTPLPPSAGITFTLRTTHLRYIHSNFHFAHCSLRLYQSFKHFAHYSPTLCIAQLSLCTLLTYTAHSPANGGRTTCLRFAYFGLHFAYCSLWLYVHDHTVCVLLTTAVRAWFLAGS